MPFLKIYIKKIFRNGRTDAHCSIVSKAKIGNSLNAQ